MFTKMKIFVLKKLCDHYAEMHSYYLSEAVIACENKKFARAEHYVQKASNCIEKQVRMVDKLMEVAW